MIVKNASGTAKIDPLMACFNASKLLELNPVAGDGNGPSIYEDREMLVLG